MQPTEVQFPAWRNQDLLKRAARLPSGVEPNFNFEIFTFKFDETVVFLEVQNQEVPFLEVVSASSTPLRLID